MKFFKTTWVLAGLLLALVAYVYFVEVKGAQKKEIQKEKEEKVLVFEKDKVDTIQLKNLKGKFSAKRIGNKKWALQEPLKVAADDLTWNTILDSIADLKFTRVISENADDLVPYGLKDPRFSVDLSFSGEKDHLSVQIGDDNPIGDSVFAAKNGSKKVVLVPQFISSTLDKDLKTLREKKLFSFDEAQTQEIEILSGKGKNKLALKKEGAKWFITSLPKKEEADTQKVSELLGMISFLEVTNFENEAPTDLAKYDLKDPDMKVTLRDQKTSQLQLLIGKKEGNGIYVAKAAEKPVYQVAQYILERIPTDSQKLIAKK